MRRAGYQQDTPDEWERDLRLYRMELVLITRQLAVMLEAGVDLRRALSVLAESAAHESTAVVLLRLCYRIERGARLSSAMRDFPKVFDRVFLAMVEVGEETGKLVVTLGKLADWLSAEDALIRKVRSAMTYPGIVLIVAGLLTVAFFTLIFPGFESTLASLPELPLMTRVLLFISRTARDPLSWALGLGTLIFLVASARRYLQRPGARAQVWRALSRLPLVGEILRDCSASRFSSAMAILLATGVDFLKSFQLACLASGSPLVVEHIQEGTSSLSLGGDLADFMRENGDSFPVIMSGLVQVGQESARLPFCFDYLQKTLNEMTEFRLRALTAMLEPFLMAWVSILVGLLVIGVALPMYGLINEAS